MLNFFLFFLINAFKANILPLNPALSLNFDIVFWTVLVRYGVFKSISWGGKKKKKTAHQLGLGVGYRIPRKMMSKTSAMIFVGLTSNTKIPCGWAWVGGDSAMFCWDVILERSGTLNNPRNTWILTGLLGIQGYKGLLERLSVAATP